MWPWLMCNLSFWVFLSLEGILSVCARAEKEPGACESEEGQRGRSGKASEGKDVVLSKYYEWKVMWLVSRHFSKLRCEATEVWLHCSLSQTLLEWPHGPALPSLGSAVSPACASLVLSSIWIEVAKYRQCSFTAGSVPWSGMLLIHIMASTSTKQELQLSGTVCRINKIRVDC